MPRVSAKRKARSESGRLKMMKRWGKEKESPHMEQQQVGEPLPASASTSFPEPPTQSAASFRHSLIPEQYREVQEVSESSATYNISHQRLSELMIW